MVHHYREEECDYDRASRTAPRRVWGSEYGIPHKYGRMVEDAILNLDAIPDNTKEKQVALRVQSQMQCILLRMHMDRKMKSEINRLHRRTHA